MVLIFIYSLSIMNKIMSKIKKSQRENKNPKFVKGRNKFGIP